MENFEVVGHCDFVQGELELVRSNWFTLVGYFILLSQQQNESLE